MAGNDLSRRIRDALPLLPFFAVVVIFLIIPTVTVIVSGVYADGVFSFEAKDTPAPRISRSAARWPPTWSSSGSS